MHWLYMVGKHSVTEQCRQIFRFIAKWSMWWEMSYRSFPTPPSHSSINQQLQCGSFITVGECVPTHYPEGFILGVPMKDVFSIVLYRTASRLWKSSVCACSSAYVFRPNSCMSSYCSHSFAFFPECLIVRITYCVASPHFSVHVGAHVVHCSMLTYVCTGLWTCACVYMQRRVLGVLFSFSPPYTLEAESLTEPGAKLRAEKASTMLSASHSAEVIGLCVAMPKGCLFIKK